VVCMTFYVTIFKKKLNSYWIYVTGENKGIPSCTLSRLTCDTFLRDALLNKQMRIEIWVQGSKGQWKLVKNVGSVYYFIM
jgi:DNA mismatch repair protein MSH2